jgi:hypothetical protein
LFCSLLVALRWVAFRSLPFRCVAFSSVRCVEMRCVEMRSVALRCVLFRCVALRWNCVVFVIIYFGLLLLTFSCERILMLLTCLSYNFMRTSLSITMLIKFLPSCQYLPIYDGLPTIRCLRMSAIICLFVLLCYLFVLYCFCSLLVVNV